MGLKRKDRIMGVKDAKCKAHLVVEGFTRKKHVEFNYVISLIVKYSNTHVIFIMVNLFVLKLQQLNVKIIFLYSELNKRIYMHQLESFII
jgi:hypothetical protein